MASAIFSWILNGALASSVILVCGRAAVRCCRQPADRVRVIQCSLGATLVALVLLSRPSFTVLSLGLLDAESDAAVAVPSTAQQARATSGDDAMTSKADAPAELSAPSRGDVASSFAESANENEIDEAGPSTLAPINLQNRAAGIISAAYVAGVLMMMLYWALALVRLKQLRRGARPASAEVQREFARITGGKSDGVSLLASERLTAPIMWGVRRPVIMLPSSTSTDDDKTRLRYYLAHEWTHVMRRDSATWQLATLLQFFLYYQPLFWHLRRQLGVSMDQLADAAAAGQGESTPDYAAFLLELARRQWAPAPAASLGIVDKGSSLRQRIGFLLKSTTPLRSHCPRRLSLVIGAAALLLGVLSSGVRLDAELQATPPDADAAQPTPEGQAPTPATVEAPDAGESITYTGVVTDQVTGLPISGVKVSIIRRISRENYRIIETTDHETNHLGVYSFIIPPEQAAEAALYLEVEADHPDYAAKGRSGYSHAMILKNLKMGEEPFYAHIGLWPGQAITGTIVSPEGTPLAGVEISMYSASDESKEFPAGSFDKTTTDDQGRFRIVPPTPGDGVLWIKPNDYSPQALRIRDRRGDWGTIEMQDGAAVVGRVLDVDSQPVPGVRIEARRSGDGEEADDYLNNNAVANQIGREADAGADGEFTLQPLPDGEYELRVTSTEEGYNPTPLPHVFLRQQMTIADGKGPDSLEIRAVPHVVIQATYLDSQGKPRSGHEVTLFGRMDGDFYAEQSSVPRNDGKLEVRAPHGLQEVQLDLLTNEHSALRWRMAPGERLQRGRRVDLGTVEDDVTGIEIVRYVAPILLVKPVDDEGRLVDDCEPVLKYVRDDGDQEEMTVYTTGGHVSFEHQQDGRWRSSQLLPDEPATITLKKEGYTAEPQEFSLAEGDEQELVVVLTKNPTEAP